MPIHIVFPADTPRLRGRLLMRAILSFTGFVLSGYALAQGFPGGGAGGGMHGGHGQPPSDSAHARPTQETEKHPDPLEGLLRAAHDLRQNLALSEAQTERWAEMQADLRDVVDKRKALELKPTSVAQVQNPALLFVQDMAVAGNVLGQALENLSRSMQSTFDALDDRQKEMFVQGMTTALSRDSLP